MNPQPKALVLADALEELDVQFSHTGLCGEAADELRRLHEVNQDLLASVVELLNSIQPDRDWHKAKRARAAIAKATGEKA
jgi:lipopolysaccharide biosynthesis regulator YciM